ncbi:MAG: hypothetical protein Q7S18_03450, partial [bacterium]|nr:hypothetical protein [bacterium]
MAEIYEFPKKITQDKEIKSIEPAIRTGETIQTIERVIRAITESKSEKENNVIDLEALKDIFSIFSVKESAMINLLSQAEEEKKINREDKILLFAIFIAFKDNNSENSMRSIIDGKVEDKTLENINQEVKDYLLK